MGDKVYLEIESWKNGLPTNNNKYLDWRTLKDKDLKDTKNKKEAIKAKMLTSPYGILKWVIGNEDTFICFDYAELPDDKVLIDSVYNSESGCFIKSFDYEIIDKKDLAKKVQYLINTALDILFENGIEHDREGWNQKPFDFLEHICNVFNLENPNKN